MIDFSQIEKYRENNRIEAKKAMGGLPKSIWETYSAFANTLGGIILLGVEEYPDKSLHVVNLPDPEQLVEEFWELVNEPRQASVNILSDQNVRIETVNGARIVVITVPRAQRMDRPVYVDGNPLTGTYLRDGEGDCRCTREEVQSMLRDASIQTVDMKLLVRMGLEVLDFETVHRYRASMWDCRPDHVWETLEDDEFLYKLGAVGKGADGQLHPTAGGLLMFGYEYEIVREFPNYFLDYREQMEKGTQLTYRLVSSSGDWSGNLYDFYVRVCDRLVRGIRMPSGRGCQENAPVHRALREALANSVINADYRGRQGLVIVKRPELITIANPGGFRIGIEAARNGGISDPRNAVLVKMFHLVNVGRRTGSGIPGIYAAWREQGWVMPSIKEQFKPDRITVSLSLGQPERKSHPMNGLPVKNLPYREAVLAYLTDHISVTSLELSEALHLRLPRVRSILRSMIAEGIVVAHGGGASRTYKLKA